MNLFQKIGLLWKANKLAKEVKKMDKSKWFEREFVMNAIGIIATVWGMLDGFIPKEMAVKILGGLLILYTASRTLIKMAQAVTAFTKSTKDDEMVAKISAVLDIVGEKLPAPAVQTVNVNSPSVRSANEMTRASDQLPAEGAVQASQMMPKKE